MALEDSNRAEMAMTEPRFARSGLLLACAMACATAGAQQAPQPAAAASAAERAQREADRTMYWIRVVGARPAPAKPAPAPRPAPVAAAARPSAPTAVHEVARTPAAPASPSLAAASAPAAAAPAPDVPAPAPDAQPAATEPVPLPPQDAAPAPAEEPDPGLVQVASVEPDFPADLVRRLHKGNVEIRFEVDVDGKVSNAVVVDTSHSHLNHAALLAVRQWRFKPAPMTHVALVNLVFDTDKTR